MVGSTSKTKKPQPRVGIYAGVFDPVHHGHLGLAEAALHLGLVDKVYLIVEQQPRTKTTASDYRHRLSMAWLATHEHPKIDLLVWDEPQLTLRETLPKLEEKFGAISLIMGSDQAQHLHTWADYDMLKTHRTRLIIGERQQAPISDVKLPLQHVVIHTNQSLLSSSEVRASANNRSQFLAKPVYQYIAFNKLY